MAAGLRPERIEDYKKLPAAVWPDVLKMIGQCHIRNYSIYLRRLDGGPPCLFSYFEYTRNDFAADMARMAADPATQKWRELCRPCMARLEDSANGQGWAEMQELFHAD
jgi:L-rhamnose mutarotase